MKSQVNRHNYETLYKLRFLEKGVDGTKKKGERRIGRKSLPSLSHHGIAASG
jgi:hypothetical protein